MTARDGYLVTAPDERERRFAERGPALSLAITYASRAAGPVTSYVRDAAGVVIYRVERDEVRTLRVLAADTERTPCHD